MRHLFMQLLLLCSLSLAYAQPVINKCIVNGKTIYSDEKCPRNAKQEEVEIHHAAGIVSPDRETVTDTINRMHDERWVNAEPGRSITRTSTRKGETTEHTVENPIPKRASRSATKQKVDCDAIQKRIARLDALARQPQKARRQEQIRREKADKQSEAIDAGC
jgi:hypothetical protein